MSIKESSSKKIKSLTEIATLCEHLRTEGKSIVTTNGSYDIVHAGHVRSLEESRAQGDILIVGINSDASVKAYKSPLRPIIHEQYRAEMIAAFQCVDFVFLFDELNPIAFINILKPDVHTNGIEYGENCIERDAVLSNGGKLYLLKDRPPLIPATALTEKSPVGISTSAIVQKIISVYKAEMSDKK